MIRPRFTILALFALLTTTTTTQAVDKDKLRRAASLPNVSYWQGFGFSSASGFSLDQNKIPLPERIAALRKSLKQDSANAENYCRLGDLYTKMSRRDEAKEAYTTAEELCQRQLDQHPDDIAGDSRLRMPYRDSSKTRKRKRYSGKR